MNAMEMLWGFMQEDIKADRIANEIRNSPVRQKLEKTRDFILEQQKAYQQLEEQVLVNADRKDAIRDALNRATEQLDALQKRFDTDPPQDAEAAREMLMEVERCRKTISSYEQEMRRIAKESNEFDRRSRTIRRGTAQAKQEFDQMKAEYNEASKARKAEYEQQRAAADKLKEGIPVDLLAAYIQVKKQITPPMARLVGGQCSGCNTSQPSAALRKIDAGGELVECETCGRILMK